MSKYSLAFVLLSKASISQTATQTQSGAPSLPDFIPTEVVAKLSELEDPCPENDLQCRSNAGGQTEVIADALANFEDQYSLDLCWCPSYFGDTSNAQGHPKNEVDKLCREWHTCVRDCLDCNNGCYEQASNAAELINLMYGIGYYYDVERDPQTGRFECIASTYDGQQTETDANCGHALCRCHYQFADALTELITNTMASRSGDAEEAVTRLFTFTYDGYATDDNTVGCVGQAVHQAATTAIPATHPPAVVQAAQNVAAATQAASESHDAADSAVDAAEAAYLAYMNQQMQIHGSDGDDLDLTSQSEPVGAAPSFADLEQAEQELEQAAQAEQDAMQAQLEAQAAANEAAAAAEAERQRQEEIAREAEAAAQAAANAAAQQAAQEQAAAAAAAAAAQQAEQERQQAAAQAAADEAAARLEAQQQAQAAQAAVAAAQAAAEAAAAADAAAQQAIEDAQQVAMDTGDAAFGDIVGDGANGGQTGGFTGFNVASFDFGGSLTSDTQAVASAMFDTSSDGCFDYPDGVAKSLGGSNEDEFGGPGGFGLALGRRR